MHTYLRRLRTLNRDIRLFFAFILLITIGFGVFGLAYNLYLIELGFREDFIGVFNAIFTLSIAIGALSIGAALRRIGTWRALLVGAIATIVMQIVLALVEDPRLILGMAVIYGFGLAYLTTTTMPFIIDWGRPSARPQTASIAFALGAVAATIGALMGGYVPEIAARIIGGDAQSPETYRIALVIGSALGVFGLIPLLRMREARKGKARDAGRSTAAKPSSAERHQTRKDVTVYVMLGGVLALGLGTVIPFYAVFLTLNGVSPGWVGFIYAAGNLLGAFFSLLGPVLVQRFGNLRVNFAVRAMMVPIYIVLILFPATWVVVFAHLVRSVALNMGGPLDSTFVADILPPRLQASAIGYRTASWNFCWALSSVVGGWVIVNQGYSWTFAALVVGVAIASVTFLVYFGRHPLVRAGKVPIALPRRQRAAIAARLVAEEERAAAPRAGEIAEAEAIDLIRDPDNRDAHRTTSTTVDLDGELAAEVGVDLHRADPAAHSVAGSGVAGHGLEGRIDDGASPSAMHPTGSSGLLAADETETSGSTAAGSGVAASRSAPDRRS